MEKKVTFRPVRDIGTAWCCFKVSDRANETVMNATEQVFLRICTWSCETGVLMVSKWFAIGVKYSRVCFCIYIQFLFHLFKRSWNAVNAVTDHVKRIRLSRRIRPCIVRLLNTPPSVGIAASWDQAAVVRISGTIAESHWVKTLYPAIHGTSFNTSSTN